MQWITLLRASPAAIGRGKIPGGEVRHHVGRALDMTRGIHAQWCEDAAIEEVAEAPILLVRSSLAMNVNR